MSKSVCVLVALLAHAVGAETTPGTMKYHVSGRQKEAVDPARQTAREKELKEKYSLAMKSAEDLGKDLEKRHGKSRDAWPAAARQQYDETNLVVAEAKREHDMAAVEQKEIDESVADLKQSFRRIAEKGRPGQVQLVDNRDEANAAVEVLARSATARAVTLHMKVTPIHWLPPAELAALSLRRGGQGYGYESAMVPEKAYSEKAPYWDVAVWLFITGGGRWKGVAEDAAELLVEAALGHLDAFRHKDPKPPASR